MKLAVLSDTHDNIWQLEAALPHLQSADAVIHCGDLISPFIIKQLGEALGDIPLHIVWGNNDGDKWSLTNFAAKFDNITLHGELAELELDGCRIAVNHYPHIANGLAHSGKYDLVCYGHDHTAHQEKIGDTLLLNPGEIMGLNGYRSLALYDTETREAEEIEIN